MESEVELCNMGLRPNVGTLGEGSTEEEAHAIHIGHG